MNKKTVIRTARRIFRLAGNTAPYIVYGTGQAARGPYNCTAAGRLAAARAFHYAPAPDGAVLYAGETEIARN